MNYTINGENLMRSMVLLVALTGLAGCAAMGPQSGKDAGLADVRAKITMGVCDDGLVSGLKRSQAPELEQEAAYICLQQGELEAVEQLLTDYSGRHRNGGPHPDYSAYLLALAQQVRFELTNQDDVARLREGREAHRRYADFARSYPASEYRTEVGPRLNSLLEEMAQAEFRLAEAAAQSGDRQTAQQRMEYLLRYYPHSSVARQASDWLEHATRDEPDNTPPGTAW
jgi:TolA-binding protein